METLRNGSRGPDVQALQTALIRAGFLTGRPDGVFGAVTAAAVTQFQKQQGLVPDAIVGPATWEALRPYLTGFRVHEIRPGDTLFALARQYNTAVDAILTANPGIRPENLAVGQRMVIPLAFSVVPTDIAYTSQLLAMIIEGLSARYPFIAVSAVGESVLGKPIPSLTIGTGSNRVMVNASHHANEWITTPVVMRFLEQFAAVFQGRDLPMFRSVAEAFYANTTLTVIPMVNPDGVDLVTGAIPPGSEVYENARAMNYLRLPFPSGWKANIRGVDLNLNYPAGWEIARDIKYSQGYVMPGPRDFVGEYPLSEPESRAMAELTRRSDFAMTLSYHTQGEVIFWRYLDYLPPRSEEIARLFSRVSGYRYEETPYGSGHAGYKDWFIQEYNRPGYTVEAGLGVNPLPISDFPGIYRDNVGILTLAGLI